ncbi:hypothetical protein NPIL_509961 [Nephila pilipes]|uniref:Peptidase A2 domain-containing protein n=1 Tax=Nephila pilipes TaxID=299642 RepID=A0A8X6NBY7_NEPPI|nr:hypothetical protein NPIL_509961 [Nephila pilipes]
MSSSEVSHTLPKRKVLRKRRKKIRIPDSTISDISAWLEEIDKEIFGEDVDKPAEQILDLGEEVAKYYESSRKRISEIISDYEMQLRVANQEISDLNEHVANLEAELVAAQEKIRHLERGAFQGDLEESITEEQFMANVVDLENVIRYALDEKNRKSPRMNWISGCNCSKPQVSFIFNDKDTGLRFLLDSGSDISQICVTQHTTTVNDFHYLSELHGNSC